MYKRQGLLHKGVHVLGGGVNGQRTAGQVVRDGSQPAEDSMGIDYNLAGGSLRLTLSGENTMQEVDFVAETVIKAVKRLSI